MTMKHLENTPQQNLKLLELAEKMGWLVLILKARLRMRVLV